ncbi:MAG: NUDIX hydrolase [Candidatus Vogelbacteria bacterium]|nr:NUDIX hydrolase [Candidatus Vogelbacteria bacterium]
MIPKKEYSAKNKILLDAASKEGVTRKAVKLVIMQGPSLLLLRRSAEDNFPGLFELPGGGLDDHEDIFTAARRELYEETGLEIGNFISQLETLDFNIVSGSVKQKCRQYIFSVSVTGQDIILNPEEHDDYRWAARSEMDTLEILPNTRAVLQKLF